MKPALKPDEREMVKIMQKIYRLCHIPSGSRHAYTHFQADFDLIRSLTEPYVNGADDEGTQV